MKAVLIFILVFVVGGGFVFYLIKNSEDGIAPVYSDENVNSENEEEKTSSVSSNSNISSDVPVKNEAINIPKEVIKEELEKRIPESEGENFSPQHSRSSMNAAFSSARVNAELYSDKVGGYLGFCGGVEEYVIDDYNSKSHDEYTDVQWYPKIAKIPGFICVDSDEKYAIQFQVTENDGSVTLRCLNSVGFFKDGTIDSVNLSCITS